MAFDKEFVGRIAHKGMRDSAQHALKPTVGKPSANEGEHENVVAQHGPAHTTQIKKEADETHTVHSIHEDGHKNVSKGHDVHSAHEHSKKMFGAEETPEKPDETTDMSSMDDEQPSME